MKKIIIITIVFVIVLLIPILLFFFNLGPFKETIDNNIPEEETQIINNSKIHFINTGASDCFLIESNGHFGLVDSSNPPFNDGTSRAVVENEKYTVTHVVEYLDKVGVKKLDFIIATHSHSDHLGGMRIIADKYVDSNTKYYYRTYVETNEDTARPEWDDMGYYTRAIEAMNKKGVQLIEVTNQEPSFKLGDFTIKLLNTEPPSDIEKNSAGLAKGENRNSIVTLVTIDNKKVLLAADLEREDEEKVATKVGKVDILKLGHHGYQTSSQISFMEVIKPNDIIISNENYFTKARVSASLRYLAKENGTKSYLTGKVNDAIIVTFANDNYTISDASGENIKNAEIEFDVATNGNWERLTYDNESAWVYYNDGKPVYGWQQLMYGDTESWYWFDRSGLMITGWKELNRDGTISWYYFDSNGAMARGWRKIKYNNEMKTFYLQSDGRMAKNICLTIENAKHCFNENGVCYSGKNC